MNTNETRVNADGSWTLEITNMVNECLEQGGVSGRIVKVSADELRSFGIVGMPEDGYNQCLSNDRRVRYEVKYGAGKVIRKGHVIQ